MSSELNKKIYCFPLRVLRKLEILYERLRGLDFEQLVYTNREHLGYIHYQQSGIYARRVIGRYLRGKITNDDSIIDLGCGKGKMVYFFTKFPFRKVTGLEYEQTIVDIAKKNMSILHTWGGGIIQGDARDYKDYDNYNYFFLFNPFTGSILSSCLKNIKTSVLNNPRKIYIIYSNPTQKEIFEANGFKLEEELHIPDYYRCSKILVYSLPL